MSLKRNSQVYVKSLKKNGVVLGTLKGKYRVAVGSVVVECDASDLTMMKGPSRVRQRDRAQKREPRSTGMKEVDLHGMRVEEALRVVEEKLNRAILDNADGLRIIHGIGTGALKIAIHNYLSGLSVVASYREDQVNPGMTVVWF